ncbi:SGNH/GDSL hydrolase family protein [Actinoplanes sp. CA-252034]|uniref:SGNH/GDSL hydrolase family protein n=1 Tax=Actinoplanes sp. CA-252034 TaxID=3239906 RepID=UPI003D95E4B7
MTRSRFGTVASSLAGLLFCTGLATPAAASPGEPPLRIMPLGDSITVGVGSPGKNGWRAELQRRLRSAGVSADFVGSENEGTTGDLDHEGHGGWTIERIAGIVDRSLAEHRPDVVLLHAGTNNITRSDDPMAAARKLSDLIDRVVAGAPQAEIYVAKIIGTAVASEVPANRAYNALVPAVVQEKGPRVHLVDQSTVAGLDIYDAHHPNEFGYRKMAYTWYEAMRGTTHPEWPGTGNPFKARQAYLCHAQSRTERDCRTWHLRRVIVSQKDGQTVTADRWQTVRPVTTRVRVWVPGHHHHRRWVSGHHEIQNRRTTRWSNV